MTAAALGPTLPADRVAQVAIRDLLDGLPPRADAPADLGRWAETVAALHAAHAAAGSAGVRRAFATLSSLDPALVTLLAAVEQECRLLSVCDLYAAEPAPPHEIITGLLTTGLNLLASRPKYGKSFLALQMSSAVGTGRSLFGLQAERGRVLFLALEDTRRRLRDRLEKQQVPADADITFATEWAPLSERG